MPVYTSNPENVIAGGGGGVVVGPPDGSTVTGLRGYVPVGGLTGEVLTKATGADFDTEWAAGGGGGAVTSVNGAVGVVVLDTGDISSVLNSRYVTDAQLTSIGTIASKADLASPIFTGTVTIPTPFTLGAVSVLPTGTELNFVDGVTSAIQPQIDGKQPIDADLTTIAGLTATTDSFMQSKASAWASRTIAQVKTDLSLSGTNTGDQTISDATISTTDITTNNATTAKHGFAPKGSGIATEFLNGNLGWTVPAGGGGSGDVVGPSSAVDSNIVAFDTTTGKLIKDSGVRVFSTYRQIQEALGYSVLFESYGRTSSDMTATLALADSQIRFVAIYIDRAVTLTGVKWYQTAIGNYTADNYNGVGLYTYSAGTMTLVASTTNDGAIWQTAAATTFGTKAFSSTYAASAGLHFLALLYNSSAQTTAPSLGGYTALQNAAVGSAGFSNSAKVSSFISSITALPTPTQVMSGTSGNGNLFYVALY